MTNLAICHGDWSKESQQGTMLERYEYSPYGKATIFNASNATIAASAIGNPILFTGRWLDSESGLYDYRARAYSLTTGRFLQRDPLGYADSMNLYQYARNNPVNLIDPMGKEVVIPGPWMASPYYWMGVAVVSGYIAWNAAHNSSRGFHLPDLNWDWQLPTFPSNNLEKSNMCILRSGKNRIPDQGVPGTIATNGPGTTKKLYGDDGWVTLEWNKGHTDHAVGTVERDDHVHPQTTQPNGKATDRGEARKPTKEDKEKLKLP